MQLPTAAPNVVVQPTPTPPGGDEATPEGGDAGAEVAATSTPSDRADTAEVLGESLEATPTVTLTPAPTPTTTGADGDGDGDDVALPPSGNVTISEGGSTGARVAVVLVAGTVPWMLFGAARWRRTHN